MLLKIQAFLDVTLCCWASGATHVDGSCCWNLQEPSVQGELSRGIKDVFIEDVGRGW